MIKDDRQAYKSISSVEPMKDVLVAAGSINNLPSFYSYAPYSLKINYELKYFIPFDEVLSLYNEVTNFGYNIGSPFSSDAEGNMTNITVGGPIYIDGSEYFQCSIQITKYPPYSLPSFLEETNFENQTQIVGFYINGDAYIDDMKNHGIITRKTTTIALDDATLSNIEVTPKREFGNNTSEFILSANSNNLKYIIDSSNNATLYADIEITTIK